MKKYIMPLVLGMTLSVMTSCDDFLDTDPSKSTSKTITDVSQLDALLASYSAIYSESNYTFLGTDDYGLTPENTKARTSSPGSDDLDVFTWAGNCERSNRNLWDGEWSKVFRANLVLNNVDGVNGSDVEKARVKAEAHFVRAYSMFQLAVCHCLYPNAANASELGLPLKATTSFEESVERLSLGETFDFILADIDEALKIDKKLQSDGKIENWRATTASVRAFAARVNLYLGKLDTAKKYADEVIAEYSVLKDFNDPAEMYYHAVNDTYVINMGTPDEETVTVRYPYTKQQLYGTNGFPELLGWKELLYVRTMSYASWWYFPSEDLLATFARDIKDGNPDNDLRYRYFVIEDFGLRYCSRTDAGRLPGYCQFYFDNLISGPTVAEMLLIRAEVQARTSQGDFGMADLNNLRKARIATEAYTALSASSAAQALKYIIDERRREMPFTIRWYDLKRYNNNNDASDDVTVNHPFYPYTSSAVQMQDAVVNHTLTPDSRHWAMPIPNVDILRSDNVLVQNQY